MQEGDLVVSISNRDVKWLPHDEVVSLIRESGNTLCMYLVTPCDKTYYKLPKVSKFTKTFYIVLILED